MVVAVRELSTDGRTGCGTRFASLVRASPQSILGVAMADLAFVVTVLAAFALVALVARGVTKL
ncbi:hypothetical protein [Streptomyces longwoodensis]|uniref:hypothetical protein n=1 Tax=Streptomyces longwoodensis TaxID=68231 RepID=UPI00324A00B6